MSTSFATISVGVKNASDEQLGNTKLDRAIHLVVNGRAEIVEADDSRIVRSMGVNLPFPKVIRLLKYIKVPFSTGEQIFSKAGVLERDNYTCGYCGKTRAQGAVLTHDHILPRSRGGKDEWMNAITACTQCNSFKAARLPEEAGMTLLFEPKIPMKIYFHGGKKKNKNIKL